MALKSLFVVLGLFAPAVMPAQVKTLKDTPRPTRVSEQMWVIPSGWSDRIPPTGPVNAPGHLAVLAPAQHIALALLAEGADRDLALQGRTLQVRITSSRGSELITATPSGVRHIKAEGADMALSILKAGGIKGADSEDLQQKMSLVSLVSFELPWEAPAVTEEEVITLQAELKGGATPAPALKPLTLELRPWSAWWEAKKGEAPDLNAFEKGFHEQPEPGLLLPMLKEAVRQNAIQTHGVYGFFVAAFRSQLAARDAVMAELPKMDPKDRWAVLMVLRLGGMDVSKASAGLAEDAQKALMDAQPLADPPALLSFEDPVDPQLAGGLGIPMDQCWGGWMATGDPKYLKGLVGQLAYASCLQDLETFMKTKPGAKGLNAKVARGLAYRTAGWSLSAFEREDPQVADWIAYWQRDSTQPAVVRTELETLATNPAFRQSQ